MRPLASHGDHSRNIFSIQVRIAPRRWNPSLICTRLLKHALELKKPVMLLNIGPTRADGLPGVEKLDVPGGAIMRDVVKNIL